MTWKFNPPPGWPTFPSGWMPPVDWEIPDEYPAAPVDWDWYLAEYEPIVEQAPVVAKSEDYVPDQNSKNLSDWDNAPSVYIDKNSAPEIGLDPLTNAETQSPPPVPEPTMVRPIAIPGMPAEIPMPTQVIAPIPSAPIEIPVQKEYVPFAPVKAEEEINHFEVLDPSIPTRDWLAPKPTPAPVEFPYQDDEEDIVKEKSGLQKKTLFIFLLVGILVVGAVSYFIAFGSPLAKKKTTTPVVTPSPIVIPSQTPIATPTPIVTPSATATPSIKPTPIVTPTPIKSLTAKPTAKPKPIPTPSLKPKPTVKPTVKPKPIPTPSLKPKPTVKPTVKPKPTKSPVIYPPAGSHLVQYYASGAGLGVGDVTYATGLSQSRSSSGSSSIWKSVVTVYLRSGTVPYINIFNHSHTGNVTCVLKVDGVVEASNTSKGYFTNAYCEAPQL
jgi:hypothetical protein